MDGKIRTFFSQDEVGRLESQLPCLRDWSASMLVPFQARQLSRAYVLWINSRWFLERGIDTTEETNRKRVSNWLLEDFGWAIRGDADPPDAFTDAVRTLHADRYGSTTGTVVHGGSGRVATVGCFQAKGVGITPLVGIGANWVHSNGCASIEEAVREAIYSEIADAEFPHGAVPVVAIIDTGLYFSSPAPLGGTSQQVRRAIIVRPAVLRLAHAERAPLFVRSLTNYSPSQIDDVCRTRDVVSRWLRRVDELPAQDMTELVQRIAEQVAFGQVHRLFNGGYFSSNLSATGSLVDFGGMRALPNWASARTLDNVAGFGEEMRIVLRVIQSLVFYFNKYQPASLAPLQATHLFSQCMEAYTKAFERECLRMWNLDPSTDAEAAAAMMRPLLQYFSQQQKLRVNYKHGLLKAQGWLYYLIADVASDESSVAAAELETASAIKKVLETHCLTAGGGQSECLQASWACAVRYLMPRPSIDREPLQHRINRALNNTRDANNISTRLINEFIHTTVGMSRRHWPRLVGDLVVQAHVSNEGSSALVCRDFKTGQLVLWLEGIHCRDTCWLFGSRLSPRDALDLNVARDGLHWTARAVPPHLNARTGFSLELTDCRLHIPDMQVRYASPRLSLTAPGPSNTIFP